MLTVAALLAIVIFASRAQDSSQGKAERYIKESESQWAEAGIKGGTATIERILADDFLGVASHGSFTIKRQRLRTRGTIAGHWGYGKVRFLGDTAVRNC